jgi:hypothetical protein
MVTSFLKRGPLKQRERREVETTTEVLTRIGKDSLYSNLKARLPTVMTSLCLKYTGSDGSTTSSFTKVPLEVRALSHMR